MGSSNQGPGPSMDEILASIRRIIEDDPVDGEAAAQEAQEMGKTQAMRAGLPGEEAPGAKQAKPQTTLTEAGPGDVAHDIAQALSEGGKVDVPAATAPADDILQPGSHAHPEPWDDAGDGASRDGGWPTPESTLPDPMMGVPPADIDPGIPATGALASDIPREEATATVSFVPDLGEPDVGEPDVGEIGAGETEPTDNEPTANVATFASERGGDHARFFDLRPANDYGAPTIAEPANATSTTPLSLDDLTEPATRRASDPLPTIGSLPDDLGTRPGTAPQEAADAEIARAPSTLTEPKTTAPETDATETDATIPDEGLALDTPADADPSSADPDALSEAPPPAAPPRIADMADAPASNSADGEPVVLHTGELKVGEEIFELGAGFLTEVQAVSPPMPEASPMPPAREPPPAPTPDTGATSAPAKAKSLEDTVIGLLEPMLHDWLDANMPAIAERIAREYRVMVEDSRSSDDEDADQG